MMNKKVNETDLYEIPGKSTIEDKPEELHGAVSAGLAETHDQVSGGYYDGTIDHIVSEARANTKD